MDEPLDSAGQGGVRYLERDSKVGGSQWLWSVDSQRAHQIEIGETQAVFTADPVKIGCQHVTDVEGVPQGGKVHDIVAEVRIKRTSPFNLFDRALRYRGFSFHELLPSFILKF